jgi:hypothetical protein
VTLKSYQDPDPHGDKKLDPDPHWNESGSTTLVSVPYQITCGVLGEAHFWNSVSTRSRRCFRVYRRYQMPSSIFLHRYCLVFPGCLCESLLCSVLVVISLPLEILLRVSLLIRSTTVKWGNIVIGFYIVTSVENFLTSHNSRSNEFIRLV